MFSYGGDGFKINADLILGAEIGYVKDAKQTHFLERNFILMDISMMF